jgi:hypothetical protein
MDKWLKVSVAAASLMAGAGVFYHYVVYLSGLALEARQAADPRPARPVAHDQCRQAAQLLYDVTWASACMTVAIQEKTRHAECLQDTASVPDALLRKAQCDHKYGEPDGTSDCSLPPTHAAMVNASLKEAEDRCVVEERRAKKSQ